MGNHNCTPKQAKAVCGRCIKIPYTQTTQIVSCGLLRRFIPPSSNYKPGLVHFFIRTMDDAGRYVEHHWTKDGLCASHDEPLKSDKLLWHINLFESGVRMGYETIGATYKCKGPYKIMSNNCIHATNRLIKLVEEEVSHSGPPSRKSITPSSHFSSAPSKRERSTSYAPSKRQMTPSNNRSLTDRTSPRPPNSHRTRSSRSFSTSTMNSTSTFRTGAWSPHSTTPNWVEYNRRNVSGPRYASEPEKQASGYSSPPNTRSSMRGPDKNSSIYL